MTPLLLVLLPTTGTIVAVLLGASGTWLIQSAYCFVTLLPVLNPLYALLLVKSYRNALCSWFKPVEYRKEFGFKHAVKRAHMLWRDQSSKVIFSFSTRLVRWRSSTIRAKKVTYGPGFFGRVKCARNRRLRLMEAPRQYAGLECQRQTLSLFRKST